MKKIVFIFAGLLSSSVLGQDSGDPLGLGSEVSDVPTTGLSGSMVLVSHPGLDVSVASIASSAHPEESITGSVQSLDGNTQPGTPADNGGGSPRPPHAGAQAPLPTIIEDAPATTTLEGLAALLQDPALQANIQSSGSVVALTAAQDALRPVFLALHDRINVLNPPPPAPPRTWVQTRFIDPIKPYMTNESLACLAIIGAGCVLKLMGYNDCRI